MTNNPLTPELRSSIDEAAQGRDIEKHFDHFTDLIMTSITDRLGITEDQYRDELKVTAYISQTVR